MPRAGVLHHLTHLTPTNLFLVLAALNSLLGLLHVLAPYRALSFEGLEPSLLANPVVEILYRSHGLSMVFTGAAYCALHHAPTASSLRVMGAAHLLGVVFSAWVATHPHHKDVSGGLPAVWGLFHLLVALYLLTVRHPHGHRQNKDAPAVTVVAVAPEPAMATLSPRRKGRSPARKTT